MLAALISLKKKNILKRRKEKKRKEKKREKKRKEPVHQIGRMDFIQPFQNLVHVAFYTLQREGMRERREESRKVVLHPVKNKHKFSI